MHPIYMKLAILGFGREGQSTLTFLLRDPNYQGAEITILDAQTVTPKLSKKDAKRVAIKSGAGYLKNLEEFNVIFRSPGIPLSLPELRHAEKKGAMISSATKLFFAHCPAKIIGVTGTKGKGTTATLLYRTLKAAKQDVYFAGNVGTPMLDILPKLKKASIVVLELSSFQLQDLEQSPDIAVVLDMFPDHQDAHKSVREYYAAKSSITRYQTSHDIAFFFEENAESRKIGRMGAGKKISISENDFDLFAPSDLRMKGAHNFKNAVMASRVAQHLSIPDNVTIKTITSFAGNEHRLEFVRAVKGIKWYNDSASTTPESLAAAITSFPGESLVVIAGGKDKNLNYSPVLKALASEEARGLKEIILFGENKMKIAEAIKKAGVEIKIVKDMKSAITEACRAIGSHGGTVVFSPGATSFDMFKNYVERGEQFKKLTQ
jgi:UDP-N-acetylmuramoylalanine--D-glutamate ligase